MEILWEVGIAFHEPEAIEIFKEHGFRVEGRTVFPTEAQVARALDKAPSIFTVTARNPAKNVVIGGERFVFLPGYGPPFILDADGEQRQALMEDYDNFCKLVQTSRYIDMNGFLMVEPWDVPSLVADLEMLHSSIILCDKPFMGAPLSRQTAADSVEMAAIVWGGRDRIQEKPVMVSILGPSSPLQYSREMAGALIEFARAGQAILVACLVMAGSSGPVSLAGVLALQNAELLAGLTLAQLVRPGVPVIYGAASSPVDMRTGSVSIGAPEMSQLVQGTAQMADFYSLPSRGGGDLTDAHFPDIQAGMESALGLLTAVRSGINFVLHSCGILGSFISMSYEKFVVDEELCGMVRKMLRPMDLSPEAIDVESIKKVGIGGQFLTQPKTLAQCRTAFFIPELLARGGYGNWKNAGKKRLDQVATLTVARRLAAYEKPEMDQGLEQELGAFVARQKALRGAIPRAV